MWNYTEKVHDYFLNPRNVGAIEDASAIGEVGSLACGDALKLYLKIDGNRIVDAKFQTFGCASAIASSSVLTELIKGRTVDEALAVTNKDIAETLGGLPKEKMHCSVMGQEALEAAIRNWRGEPTPIEDPDGRMVCKCFSVTDKLIVRAIKENNLKTVEEVTNYTKAGGACGNCLSDIESILKEVLAGHDPTHQHNQGILDFRPAPAKPASDAPEKPARLSNIQRMQKVMQVLETMIKPRLQADGGNVELVDIEGSVVKIVLSGMCLGCPASAHTIENFIQETLREQVEPEIVVKEASE